MNTDKRTASKTSTTNKVNGGPTTEPQQKAKLTFGSIIPCTCEKHGMVHFVGSRVVEFIRNFGDIDRICLMMDDESAQKFRGVVARLQAQGKLEDLLSPEAQLREQDLEDRRQDLLDRLENTTEEADRVKVAGLNNHDLAMAVVDHLTMALSKAGLREAILNEMSERDMKIRVSVTIDYDREVVNLVIDPQDLVGKDVSDSQAEVEADLAEIQAEFRKLF